MSNGVISHELDPAIKSRIIELFQAGQPLTEIARVTGIRYSLVYFYTVNRGNPDAIKEKTGPKPRQRKARQRIPDKLPLGLMATWRQQGLTPKEMAAKLLEMKR